MKYYFTPKLNQMKNFINSTFILSCAIWLLISTQVQAQQGNITFTGKVTNQANNRPIRLASVSIAGKGIGTSTNTAGKFILLVPQANLNDSLKVSCIGYQTKSFAIAGLKRGEDLNITLEKSNTVLQEVTVTYYDPQKILQKAISRIGENYINRPHILRGFYRMYTYNDHDPLQLSEAVFDVYNFGYTDKHADIFRLIKARSEKNERDFNTLEFGQKPNSIFETDVINHIMASGFLSDDGLKNHEFNVTGIVDVNGYRTYEIAFREKPGVEGNTYRGNMYIDTKTYAFVYFDFGLSPTATSTIGAATFAKRSLMRLGNTGIDLMFDHTKVNYQQFSNKWVLSNVEGDDSLKVNNPELKYDYVAHVKFNYQITAIDTTQKESFDSKVGRNDNINAYKSNGDEKFWKDYNIILSDDNVDDIFKKIKAINKAVK